jgi:hypothetical protein
MTLSAFVFTIAVTLVVRPSEYADNDDANGNADETLSPSAQGVA